MSLFVGFFGKLYIGRRGVLVRTIFSILTILLFAIAGMLLWQWKGYSEEQEQLKNVKLPNVQQHVQMQHNSNELRVVQTIKNVKKGTYKIQNPLNVLYDVKNATHVESSLVVKETQEDVEFHYRIPFEANDSSRLLLDWAIQLEEVTTEYFKVKITVDTEQSGSWAAATKQLGKAKKEFIDYYEFERQGPVFPLYYQQGEMGHVSLDNGVVIYFEQDKKIDTEQLSSLFSNFPELDDRVLMFTSEHEELVWSDLILLKENYTMEQLEQKLSSLYLDAVLPFVNESEKWQQHVIGNILKNKQDGGEKTVAIVEILKNEMSEEELRTFVDKVVQQEKPLTSALLDEALSAVMRKETAFFHLNKDESRPLSPLYYYNPKKIVVNNQNIQESLLYVKNDELLPLASITEQAGYEYSVMEDGHLLIISDEDSLRLYPNSSVFILNGKDYSTSSSPVTMINNRVYIYKHWLTDLFGLEVSETEDRIMITSFF